MAKTPLTKKMEKQLFFHTNKMGTFGCMEVTIGLNQRKVERVDYMTYDTQKTFRCYEIKTSKADFMSKSQLSFVGHYNYLVIPYELLPDIEETEKYKALIAIGVGVITGGHRRHMSCVKRPRKQTVNTKMQNKLLDSMIRSLSRDTNKYYVENL